MAEEENQEMDEEQLKEKETVIMEIGKKYDGLAILKKLVFMRFIFRYREQGNAKELGHMMVIRPFTTLLSKTKAANVIRGVVDVYLGMEAATGYEVYLCTGEKRILIFPIQVNSTLNLLVIKKLPRLIRLWKPVY